MLWASYNWGVQFCFPRKTSQVPSFGTTVWLYVNWVHIFCGGHNRPLYSMNESHLESEHLNRTIHFRKSQHSKLILQKLNLVRNQYTRDRTKLSWKYFFRIILVIIQDNRVSLLCPINFFFYVQSCFICRDLWNW